MLYNCRLKNNALIWSIGILRVNSEKVIRMLTVKKLHKSFSDAQVLRGVDMTLAPRFVYTLTGGNGSGKTTLFNIITGFLKPTTGAVEFKEQNISRFTPFKINRMGIGCTFQDLRLALQMTALENILLAQERKMFTFATSEQRRHAEKILERVALTHQKDTPAGELSYGQQKLLTIGCCIANNAELLLLDEPVAGIDRDNFRKITALVRDLRDGGKTIFQIEHNPEYIKETSDRVLALEGGRLLDEAC